LVEYVMGLAPNIPLSVTPPAQQPGPLDLATKGLNVQALINAVQQQKTQAATQQLELQQEQIKTQQMQQQQQDMNTIREMAPKYAGRDANGNGTFDFDGLATDAQARGVNPQMINQMRMQNYQMQEAAAKAGSEKLSNEQAHNKAAYEVIEGVKGITDPVERQTAYSTGLNKLKLLNMDTSHLPDAAPDDNALSAYETQLGMHGQLLNDAKTLADTNKANAEASEKDWQKFPELGMLVNTKTGEQRNIMSGGPVAAPAMLEGKYISIQQKKALGQPLGAQDKAFSDAYEKFKTLVPQFNLNMSGGATGGLSQDAIDAQAEKYFQTGQLPPSGRGPAGVMLGRTIMQRANDLHPGESLAAGSGIFAANKKSLQEIQPKLDQVNAFENTSLKNLDLFTNLAQKAIDSGLPIANAPLRAAAGMLGGQDQAAFNAARQVAINEIAKVTSSPGLSGQLSDSARHEVESFIPANATVGQIMHVASVLKQDMENRRQSYVEQIADIQKRMGGNSQQSQPQGGASAPRTISQAQLAQAAKDHNVPVEEVKRQAVAAGIKVLDQ
jgi:hypothetical protein